MDYTSNETEPGLTVTTISGALTRGSKGEELEWALERLIEGGCRKLILDMSAVHYIDSAGLGVLVGTTGKMNQAGGKLKLAGVTDKVMMVIKVTKVDQVLSCETDVQSAAKAIGAAA